MHFINNTHTHKIINFSTSIGGGLDWSKICQMSSKVCIVQSFISSEMFFSEI